MKSKKMRCEVESVFERKELCEIWLGTDPGLVNLEELYRAFVKRLVVDLERVNYSRDSFTPRGTSDVLDIFRAVMSIEEIEVSQETVHVESHRIATLVDGTEIDLNNIVEIGPVYARGAELHRKDLLKHDQYAVRLKNKDVLWYDDRNNPRSELVRLWKGA